MWFGGGGRREVTGARHRCWRLPGAPCWHQLSSMLCQLAPAGARLARLLLLRHRELKGNVLPRQLLVHAREGLGLCVGAESSVEQRQEWALDSRGSWPSEGVSAEGWRGGPTNPKAYRTHEAHV